MKKRFLVAALVAGLSAWSLAVTAFSAEDPKPEQPSPDDVAAMWAKAAPFLKLGEHHKVLEKFMGKWKMETRFSMFGQTGPPEKGSSETKWLMDGRWLQSKWKSKIMGVPSDGFMIMGYDNFKMSYVFTMVSSADTAMLRAEGDMDPDGKTLLMYGTMDEYLTGEHDKMVKYVWRFESDDKIVMEIHDLPIGEKNTKVFEVVSTRVK